MVFIYYIVENNCPRDNFTCANGNCLETSKMCDSHNDCGDNSDEGTICSGHIIINRKILNSSVFIRYYSYNLIQTLISLCHNIGSICSFDASFCEANNFVPDLVPHKESYEFIEAVKEAHSLTCKWHLNIFFMVLNSYYFTNQYFSLVRH